MPVISYPEGTFVYVISKQNMDRYVGKSHQDIYCPSDMLNYCDKAYKIYNTYTYEDFSTEEPTLRILYRLENDPQLYNWCEDWLRPYQTPLGNSIIGGLE